MDILGKLFGTPLRVRLLRLFLFNPDTPFDRDDLLLRTKSTPRTLVPEIAVLTSAHIIKRKTFTKVVRRKQRGKMVEVERKVIGWIQNERFPNRQALRTFLADTLSLTDDDMRKRLGKAGRIALVVVGGSFIDLDLDSSVDLLIVGDRINRKTLETAIHGIEIEIGRDLRYACLSLSDFAYRRSIHDRLVRNVFDYPHRTVVDKLNLL